MYAVDSKDGKIKGTIASADGLSADEFSNEMIQKLSMHGWASRAAALEALTIYPDQSWMH